MVNKLTKQFEHGIWRSFSMHQSQSKDAAVQAYGPAQLRQGLNKLAAIQLAYKEVLVGLQAAAWQTDLSWYMGCRYKLHYAAILTRGHHGAP